MESQTLESRDLVPVKILVVVGTRPEAIKLVPMILALKQSPYFVPQVVSTGQHHEMVRDVFDLAGIEVDFDLWVGGARSELNDRVREVMGRLDDFVRVQYGADGTVKQEEATSGEYPLAILVHGDTTSAFAAALAAFHLRIPVVHVEAGLRTGSNLTPFPEEINRQLITCIAAFHLAPTSHNLENLVREEVPVSQIFITGNTGIDALEWAAGLEVEFSDPGVAGIAESDRRVVVVTAHRRENWGDGLEGIATGVRLLAVEHPDVYFVVPRHPNPDVRRQWESLADLPNVCLTDSLSYPEFARLLARSYLVITDSGGIQEEAPSLGKPVLVCRESTERKEGIEAGTLMLVGTDSGRIHAEASVLLESEEAYLKMSEAENPYGDGRASERIVAALTTLYAGGPMPEPFRSSFTRRAVIEAAGYTLSDTTPNRMDPALIPESDRHHEERLSKRIEEAWLEFGTIAEHWFRS
ncbi:MAG: UDP-N-acetylglucosamine 2-epimerase (non-hydrolyzing) [Solirubrobacterales bacterium]|nr:UDP-N-acetylglucosamine 2-epimerase (non-hydrolyzing) [Solirubrobacterales bacterium]